MQSKHRFFEHLHNKHIVNYREITPTCWISVAETCRARKLLSYWEFCFVYYSYSVYCVPAVAVLDPVACGTLWPLPVCGKSAVTTEEMRATLFCFNKRKDVCSTVYYYRSRSHRFFHSSSFCMARYIIVSLCIYFNVTRKL